MNNKIKIALIVAVLIGIAIGIYVYRNNTMPSIKGSEPDAKQPGVKKVEDGIITVNAYTKEERFHPDMTQAAADALATKILATEKHRPKPLTAGGSLAEHDAWAKERRPFLVDLTNSFYRYKDGKANKMGDKEIQQIVIFESTFNGIYN